MDTMDEPLGLTPFVVLAPPVPVEPHFARPSPNPNEIEVRHSFIEAERFDLT
jgi:hypothetical protein